MRKSVQSRLYRGKYSARGQGFTLVELLVVIAIISILAAVVVLVINPLELTRRGRDAVRLSDLANMQQAISVAVQEATASSSLAILCYAPSGQTPQTPCTDTSNDATNANVRKPDGTGWVKVNFTAQSAVTVPVLPVDPINDSTYHYTYYSDGNNWEIDAVLESDQQKGKMAADGGTCNKKYEIGTNLSLIDPTGCP